MTLPTPLLHVLNGNQGNGFILDYSQDGRRYFILFDGGERQTKPFNRDFQEQAIFSRLLVSAAREVWLRAAIGGTDNLPFNPTALVGLQSHDPYQGLLALLQSYKELGITETQDLFGGPYLLPNPVNIQDGWKVPPIVKGRYTAIDEILKTWNFTRALKTPLSDYFRGLRFILPGFDKMASYWHLPNVSQDTDKVTELLGPYPNSQSILLQTLSSSGGIALLATNTPTDRISSYCLKQDNPHFSMYQIQGGGPETYQKPDIPISVSEEFSLWALMELGYNYLGLSNEEKEEIPALKEENQLWVALPWALSKLSVSKSERGVASWSALRASSQDSDWVQKVEMSQPNDFHVLLAIEYLASVLKNVIQSIKTSDAQSSSLARYIKALRARQEQYLGLCKAETQGPLVLTDKTSPVLPFPTNQLLRQVGERLKDGCIGEDKLVNISSEVIRLGIFGFQQLSDGSYEAYPELWLYWMNSPIDGRMFKWAEFYADILNATASKKFYSTFSANTYFVSPQGSENVYGGLRPYELVGLAMARTASNTSHQTSLFLPNATMLDWKAVHRLAKAFGTSIPNILGPGKLSLQRPRVNTVYSTLHGSDLETQEALVASPPEVIPDLSSINFDGLDLAISRTKDILYTTRNDFAPRIETYNGSSMKLFQLYFQSSAAKEKFYLQVDFEVFPQKPVIDPKGPYPPPFKVAAKMLRYGLRIIEVAGDDNTDWHLAIFGPNPSGRGPHVPYRAVLHKTEGESHLMRMEYPEGSGRYFAFYERLGEVSKLPDPVTISVIKTATELSDGNFKECTFRFENVESSIPVQSPPLSAGSIRLDKFLGSSFNQHGSTYPKVLKLPFVLGVVLGCSVDRIAASLSAGLPVGLMDSGLCDNFIVDTEQSTIVCGHTSLGSQVPLSGEILCVRDSAVATLGLNPALKIQLDKLKVGIENINSAQCILTVKTTATLTVEDGTHYPLSAKVSISLGVADAKLPCWSLRFDGRPSGNQIFASLKAEALSKKDTSFMKQPIAFCKLPLQDAVHEGSIVDLELMYQQNDYGLPASTLIAVNFNTALNEWQDCLPENFPTGRIQASEDPSVRVDVQNPTYDGHARVNVLINFGCRLDDSNSRMTYFTLSAKSLIHLSDYEYRLSWSPDNQHDIISPDDILTALKHFGLESTWKKVEENMPIAKDSLMNSRVRSGSLRLQKSANRFISDEFELDFYSDLVPLVMGSIDIKLQLSAATMHLQTFYGVIKCEGKGILWIRDRALYADVRLPQKAIPGFVTIRKISGTSLSELLSIPNIAGLSLLNGASKSFSAEMETVQLQLSSWDNRSFLPKDVSSISFKFDPFETFSIEGVGTIRSVQGSFEIESSGNPEKQDNIRFYISGETLEHLFSIVISSQFQSENLVATFHPMEETSFSAIAARFLTPQATTAFDQIIENLLVDSFILNLAAAGSDFIVASCEITFAQNAYVLLNDVRINGIRFGCDLESASDGRKSWKNHKLFWTESTPNFSGEIKIEEVPNSNDGVTLTFKSATHNATALGLLDRFSIPHPISIDGPTEMNKDEYLNIPINYLMGGLGVEPTKFVIRDLHIQVDAPQNQSLVLLSSHQITVELIYLKLLYTHTDNATLATFGGVVKLLTGVEIPVTFKHADEGDRYWGRFSIASQPSEKVHSSYPSFDSLAARLLPNAETIVISPSSGVPTTLPVVSGEVSFIRGQSGTLSAQIDATAWNVKFGSLEISFGGLECHVSVTEQEHPTWMAAISGKTSFGPFVSMVGAMQICTRKKPILAARLSKGTSGTLTKVNDDIKALVGNISSDHGNWDEISPSGGVELSLDANAAMYLDFDTSAILFTGSISNIGGVAVIGCQSKVPEESRENQYLVAIGLDDPSKLWKELAGDLSEHFNFRSVTAFFSSSTWVETDLKPIIDNAMIVSEEFNRFPLNERAFDQKDIGLTVVSDLLFSSPGPKQITPGAQFQAVISLDGNKDLTNALKGTIEQGKSPLIILSAQINRGETLFGVTITELVFAGGAITLKACRGTFSPNKAASQNSKGVPTLSLDSDLEFRLPNTDTVLALIAHTDITKEGADVMVSLSYQNGGETVIKDPFGGIFGLQFKILKFEGSINPQDSSGSGSVPAQKSSFRVEGQVKIADLDLKAQLLFYAGKPKVLSVIFNDILPIEKISEGIVNHMEEPSDVRQWPSRSYPPIQFHQGIIYYSFLKEKENPLIDPNDSSLEYLPGFNIRASMSVFWFKADVIVHLLPKRAGLKITGTMETPIDRGWLKLSQRDPKSSTGNEKGPDLVYVWNKRDDDQYGVGKTRFEINAKVSLFQTKEFSCTIAYLASSNEWNGSHTYDGAADQVGKAESNVRIAYYNGRFWVTGLNVEKIWENLALDKALYDASERKDPNGCGKLVDLIFDRVLKFKYSFNINLSTTDGDSEPGIEATISTKVRIMIGDTGSSLDEIDLPEISVRMMFDVPNLEALVNWLFEFVRNNLPAVADFILDHPVEFAKIIVWMNAKKYSKELVKALLCRGVDTENIRNRFMELDPPEKPTPQPVEDKCICNGRTWEHLVCMMGRSYDRGRW